jgi:hypothetical protein
MNTEKSATIFLISIFIILVAVGAFMVLKKNDDNLDEYVYNNFRVFKNQDTIGYTIIAYTGDQPYHLQLRNDPKNTENISIDPRVRDLILQKEAIFFTMDPDYNSIPVLGASGMANIFGRRLGLYDKRVFGAITRETNSSEGNIVVDCNNVTSRSNIVKLQIEEKTKVYIDNGCIIVQGSNEWEVVRASDRLIYQALEVIKD